MTSVIETFFDLTVGLPLAIIGLLGLVICVIAGAVSAISLFARGKSGLAILNAVLVAALVAAALDILPLGGAFGAPLAMMLAFLVFASHSRLSKDSTVRWSIDPLLTGGAAISLVAIGVPLLMLAMSRIM